MFRSTSLKYQFLMSPKLKFLLSRPVLRLAVPGFLFLVLLASQPVPFPKGEVSFTWRLFCWSVGIGVVVAISYCAQKCVSFFSTGLDQLAQDALTVAVITVFLTPALWGVICLALLPTDLSGPGVWQVAKYGALFATGLLVLRRCFPAADSTAKAPSPPEQPRLVRRLPSDLDAQILRLTVRDHCVDVVTSAGTHTIRSRFVDAINEMEPVVGYCTHRSHWVTRTAIESVERQAGKIQIRLVNGDLVPVSRKYKPGLEKAGLL